MTIYRVSSTHTMTATDAESREFATPREAWEFARDDYAMSDHGEGERSKRVNVTILDTASHGTAGTVRLTTGEVVTVTEDCDCDDEGPCESHGITLVSREGAAVRTADELAHLFLLDARDLGVTLSPYGLDVLERCARDLERERRYGVAWLSSPDLHDELMTVVSQVEADLATMDDGGMTYWDDGYRIVRVTGGPLLDD